MLEASALQLDSSQDTVGRRADVGPVRLVHSSPLHGNNHDGDTVEKSFRLNEKFFDAEAHKQLIADALRRAMRDSGLTAKQLAYALQTDERNVHNWLNGNNAPSGLHIVNLITFFGWGWAAQIWGPRTTWMRVRHEHDLQKAVADLEAERAMQKMMGAAE